MKYKWNGKNSLGMVWAILFLACFLAGCDDSPSRPGEGFYSYSGYRDWWRIPLKFPFQILMIDTFANGSLEKYDSAQNIVEPNVSSSAVVDIDIVMVSPAKEYLAFLTSNKKYGIFIYQSERVIFFDSERALQKHLNDFFHDEAELKLKPLQKCYDEVWAELSKSQGN